MNEPGLLASSGTGYERVSYWSAAISGKPSIGFVDASAFGYSKSFRGKSVIHWAVGDDQVRVDEHHYITLHYEYFNILSAVTDIGYIIYT